MAVPSLLPPDHGLRRDLAAEVHNRPSVAVASPAVVSCLALTDADPRAVFDRVAELAVANGLTPPVPGVPHVILELPDVRLKWERHSEFLSLTVVRPLSGAGLDGGGEFPSGFDALPEGWLAALAGTVMAAADLLLLNAEDLPSGSGFLTGCFAAGPPAGSSVMDGVAEVFTDFRLPPSGRTRWVVLDHGMGPEQASRLTQRVAEIEIYRMMALLAFPLARTAFPELDRIEQRLARITTETEALHAHIGTADAQREERRLLDELTRIAAEVERSVAATSFRFSAAGAYWDIVQARVAEFRERRIGDSRTLAGFLSRRMAPAMNSCLAAARRQEELSARIARASALLRTRVDIAREEQNLTLLAAMERRGRAALRLQQTVEGFSVAALTYYGAGLVGYLGRPLSLALPWLRNEVLVAISVPLIAALAWYSVRRIRQSIGED